MKHNGQHENKVLCSSHSLSSWGREKATSNQTPNACYGLGKLETKEVKERRMPVGCWQWPSQSLSILIIPFAVWCKGMDSKTEITLKERSNFEATLSLLSLKGGLNWAPLLSTPVIFMFSVPSCCCFRSVKILEVTCRFYCFYFRLPT